MIRERDKSRKILNALVDYFVAMDFRELVTSIAMKEEVTEIVIEGIVDGSKVDVEKIKKLLNHPRMHEYEDMYDNILESNTEEELDTIGYFIDEARVNLDGDALSMKLSRFH